MRFGFHVSIAGGLRNAIRQARQLRCQTIQIFSRNPQGWKARPLDDEDVAEFRAGVRKEDLCPVVVHMPYLANLATPRKPLYRKSVQSLVLDLERCGSIGAQYLVLHMGRSKSEPPARALERMSAGISQALEQVPNSVMVLLENTAGLSSGFAEIQAVIERVSRPNRVGVVLDTAHLFESGLDFRTPAGLNSMLRDFDRVVGLRRLCLLHLNDSRTDLGSGLDRHEHIGQGRIGRKGFELIVNHPLLRHLPGIMETPRTTLAQDRQNLRTIRSLVTA